MANPWVMPVSDNSLITDGSYFAKVVATSLDTNGDPITAHITKWYTTIDEAYKDDVVAGTINNKTYIELGISVVGYTCSV